MINNESNYELFDLNKYIEYLRKELHLEDTIFSVIMIDNEKIWEINKEYRGIDRPTDVISFALEDSGEFISPIRILGDIYISYDKVLEQAKEYGHSIKRELFFLTTHGLLHLLGYDHIEKEDEKIMFGLQNKLLEGYGVYRN